MYQFVPYMEANIYFSGLIGRKSLNNIFITRLSFCNIREIIFRDYRVLVMGPNSLAAYLISVHMGFRTLALNERAGEIMNEFGKLKKEFEKFSGSTEDLMKKVDALQKSVNEYSTRERQMERAIDSMDKLDS